MKEYISQGYYGQITFTIPSSFDIVGKDALKNCLLLKKLVIPGTVKRIEGGAFRDCINLREVVLEEGITSLGWDLFAGCKRLHSITVPDSVTYATPYTFRSIPDLRAPVLNASGTSYIYYPKNLGETRVTIPQGIQTIREDAFQNHQALEEVVLPDTLERIQHGAFAGTRLKSVVLPESLKEVAGYAFYQCVRLKQVDIRCEYAAIRWGAFESCIHLSASQASPDQYIEWMRMLGKSLYVVPRKQELPPDGHESDPRFLRCAAGCLMGKQEAMEQMADYFHEKQESGHPFYRRAEGFWRLRLYYLGSQAAAQWLFDWIIAHPGAQMEVAAQVPLPSGEGRILRALGFLFFDPDRRYQVQYPDKNGIVEVAALEDEDGPDEDGYGRETYYDWWYMTENLAMVPGTGYLHAYSDLDKRNNKKKFSDLHDLVLDTIRTHPELVEQGIYAEIGKCLTSS